MREIKFRAWDEQAEIFCYSDKFSRTHFFEFDYHDERDYGKLKAYRLIEKDGYMGYDGRQPPPETVSEELDNMQIYTGLKDINGKGLFEGDVVKFNSRSYGTIAVKIEFIHDRCGFGGVTYGEFKPKQLKMPDREWSKKHKPCECDGAMYEAKDILRNNYFEDNGVAKEVEIIGNVFENEELLKEVEKKPCQVK